MTDETREIATPNHWEDPCNGQMNPEKAALIARKSLQEMAKLIPGIDRAVTQVVDGGIIYTRGHQPIEDPNSELHKRQHIGLQFQKKGYFSVDIGKLTSAPLNALDLAHYF